MKRASDEEVNAFMEAVFPGFVSLASAVFTEQYVLVSATKLINDLRRNAHREHPICRLQLPNGTVPENNTEALEGWKAAYDALLERWSEVKNRCDALGRWQVDVTCALRRGEQGGTHYADVPKHISDLVTKVEKLQADAESLAQLGIGVAPEDEVPQHPPIYPDEHGDWEAANHGLGARILKSERVIGNCYMLARRELARRDLYDTKAKERWGHVLRLCEEYGCKSSILRAQLPTELTEGVE